MNNLSGFQGFLVDKGFKRFYSDNSGKETVEVENYDSVRLSSYDRICYEFKKDDKYCWWGLREYMKPPVMFLGANKLFIMQPPEYSRTKEDGYRILFSKWKEDKFEEIYDVFVSENKIFKVTCGHNDEVTIETGTI